MLFELLRMVICSAVKTKITTEYFRSLMSINPPTSFAMHMESQSWVPWKLSTYLTSTSISTLDSGTCTEAKSDAVILYSNMSTPADLPRQQFFFPFTSRCLPLAPRSSTCLIHYLQSFSSPSSRIVSFSFALHLRTPSRSLSSNSSTESQTC